MGWVTSESQCSLPVTLWQQAAPAVEYPVPAVSPGLPATSGMAQMVHTYTTESVTVEDDTMDNNYSSTRTTMDLENEDLKLGSMQRSSIRRRRRRCMSEYLPPDTVKQPSALQDLSGLTDWTKVVEDVMELLCSISEHEKINTAVKHSRTAAAIGGFIIFVGGLVGGPPGIAVGGVIAGVFGAWKTHGKFQSIPQIIKELPSAERQKLAKEATNILSDLKCTNVGQLIRKVMANEGLKQKLLAMLRSFVSKRLNAKKRSMKARWDDGL
ncbi:protein C19orf12-like [Hipposideros larvatus]